MLDGQKFQRLLQLVWCSHPSLQPLQPLVEQLYQLFFETSGSCFTYNAAAAPEDFIRICEEQLAGLRPQAGVAAAASPSEGSAPAGGFGVRALPVRTSSNSTGSRPARRN